jgi:site-specific DNA recombinase
LRSYRRGSIMPKMSGSTTSGSTTSGTTGNGKKLRFASLVRVSSEQQEKEGESLPVQRAANQRDIDLLGGVLVGSYGGQEHATPGWEKKEIDRLIADAARDQFDAVIVAHADRWSRDNAKSAQGLEAFKHHGIRFFVSTTEYKLHNPEHKLFLNLSSAIGEFQASNQRKKSILSKIARARKGMPPNQKRPYGRVFDRKSGQWSIDPDKKAIIEDVAKRYIEGESLPKLAQEVGLAHASLCQILREKLGGEWVIDFSAADLDIAETVTIAVPPLLDEPTIRDVAHRLKANRTYLHKPPRSVNDYLLSGCVFCAECGRSLCGQKDRFGHVYYAHTYVGGAANCPIKPRPTVPAAWLEEQVVSQLFQMFGSPAAIERAIKAAVPDCDKVLDRQRRIDDDLAKIGKARDRILSLVAKEAITDDQAEKQLLDLKERETTLTSEKDRLLAMLADVPDERALRVYVEKVNGAILLHDEQGNFGPDPDDHRCHYVGGNDIGTWLTMTREDKKKLVRTVFDIRLADDTPAGVYVSPTGDSRPYRPKQWAFKIRGRLDFESVVGVFEPCGRRTSTTSRAAAPW